MQRWTEEPCGVGGSERGALCGGHTMSEGSIEPHCSFSCSTAQQLQSDAVGWPAQRERQGRVVGKLCNAITELPCTLCNSCDSTEGRREFASNPSEYHSTASGRSVARGRQANLVKQMCRRATHRGSDARLDTNRLMRLDAWPRHLTDPLRWSWRLFRHRKWKQCELRSALAAVRWRGRSSSCRRTRFVPFIHNQASIAVLVKDRYSLSRPLCAYTDTDRNPADAGSWVEDAEMLR